MITRNLAFLAATLALAGCGGSVQIAATDKPRGVPVRVVPVAARDLEETLALAGTLRPRAQVQVVAEVAARLLTVRRDEGARVAKGETLASLDDTDYRLAAERAAAVVQVADAVRGHALVEKERADNLQKTGGINDKEHLSAQVGLRVAEASLAQAKAEAAIAVQQLSRSQAKAPFDGRVAKRLADPGTMLASGAPLFILVDDSRLEFRAAVPSADWSKVRLGAAADITVDVLPGVHVTGTVARVTPLVDERTRTFEVVVEVPGRRDLVGGLFARATVRVGRVPGALVVPPAALLRDGSSPNEAHAFVVVAGHAEKRTVRLGVEGPDAIQVTKGLAAGEVVVLDPPASLGSGAPVEVAK